MAGSRERRRRRRMAFAAGGEIGGGGSTQQKEPADGPSAMPDDDLKKEPAAVTGLGQGEEGQLRVLERKKSDSPPSDESPCNQLPMSIGIKGLCKNRTKWKKAKAK
nr:uncharacterized protein LOC117864198 isoform X1 [Setaria viridis]